MASSGTGRSGAPLLVVLGLLLLVIDAQNPAGGGGNPGQPGQIARRFEYKYSFKPPYLAQKDGTVPFFEYSGSKSKTLPKIMNLITHG